MSIVKTIRDGDIDRLRTMLESGVDPNAADDGELPLVIAIDGKQAAMFRLLLEFEADVEASDGQGLTPLITAVAAKQPKMLRALLDAGARNFDVVPSFPSMTALMWACENGQAEMVRMLLEAGADPQQENATGQSPIMMATEHPEIVTLLLKYGVDPNQPTSTGALALPVALSGRKNKSVRLLLNAGSDPNKPESQGQPPLLIAAKSQLAPPVRALLEAGAEPNVCFTETDSLDSSITKGATPLIYAARTGRRRIVQALLQAGADWSIADGYGKTAYDVAQDAGYAGIQQLIEEVAGPELKKRPPTKEQYSALLLQSAKRGDVTRVNVALQNGADPEVIDNGLNFGMTPLMHACQRGDDAIVAALISAGADVQRSEQEHVFVGQEYTALHYAAESGRTRCVQQLLEAGAETEVFDEGGYTPLMRAALEGHVESVESLLEAGANPLAVRQSEADLEEFENDEEDIDEEFNDSSSDEDNDWNDGWEEEFDEEEFGSTSALGIAAVEGHLAIVQMLLDATDERPPQVLLDAVRALQPEVVGLLLDHGYSAGTSDNSGAGPLHLLGRYSATICLPPTDTPAMDRNRRDWYEEAERRQLEIAQMLLEAGDSVAATDNQGRTPLMIAAAAPTNLTRKVEPSEGVEFYDDSESDSVPYLTWLLNAGAEPEAKDRDGNTALHYAFKRGFMGSDCPQSIDWLIKSPVDVNSLNAKGQTPLMLAAQSGDVKGIRQLIRGGANVNLADKRGRSALHYAMDAQFPEDALRELISSGADCAVADVRGLTPLDVARDRYLEEAAKLLEQSGMEESHQLERELSKAIDANDLTEARRLINEGADVAFEIDGENAFVRSVLSHSTELVEELVNRHGVDVTQPSSGFEMGKGSQALHYAAQLEDSRLLEKLLALGADPNATNAHGWTPTMVAAFARRRPNVALLVAEGGQLNELAEDFLELFSFAEKAASSEYCEAIARLTETLGEPIALPWAEGLVHWAIDVSGETEELLQENPKLGKIQAQWQATKQRREFLLTKFNPELQKQGLMLVGIQSGRGFSPSADFLGLFPTTNPFALIATMGTYGNDDALSSPELVSALRRLNQVEPFELTNLKNDALDIVFDSLVKSPEKIAKQLSAICSDIVDSYGSKKKLVEHLRSNREVHFWWD